MYLTYGKLLFYSSAFTIGMLIPSLLSSPHAGLHMNRNTSIAGEAQRLHRELLKAGHEAKLERDRKDREAQRQRAQDRKEKEKKRTQKQERRR